MGELRELCRAHTALSDEDILRMEELERSLPLIADVANADVFLDCLMDDETALVVAQASPAQGISVYEKTVVGERAEKHNEPAVFHTFHMGIPVSDLKAITQENRAVRQNVAPVKNSRDEVIAVLIREKDISADLQQQRKYEELARVRQESASYPRDVDPERERDAIAVREMHHRVKNNLQLVASILNLQARKAQDPGVRTTLKENVNRVLSIAAIHDILLNTSEDLRTVRSGVLLEKLRYDLQALVPPEKSIELVIADDGVDMDSDVATSVALVITELVTNAFRHAFVSRGTGRVEVSVCRGELYHTVAVMDNGVGFEPDGTAPGSLGLRIVDSTVRDKLRGRLHIVSGSRGTKISFDFPAGKHC